MLEGMCLLPCWLFVSFGVWRNFCGCVRGWKKTYRKRKRMVAIDSRKSNVKKRKRVLTLLVEMERVRVFSLEATMEREWVLEYESIYRQSLSCCRLQKHGTKIEVADVVVSTNHVVFLANRFPRLISLLTSRHLCFGNKWQYGQFKNIGV